MSGDVSHDDDETELTLIINGADWIGVRHISRARPADSADGHASEDAAHDAVGRWGMPDFVMKPRTQSDGRRNRELGDGIVVTHGIALILDPPVSLVGEEGEVVERSGGGHGGFVDDEGRAGREVVIPVVGVS